MQAQAQFMDRGNPAPQVEGPMLKAALHYAALGWHVFPCKADKAPYTRHGCKDATVDNEQIRLWWTQWPDAGIGVATGQRSGIVAIDLDVDKGSGETVGENTLATLEAAHGRLPATVEAETPSGGRHYLFKCPDWEFPNTVQKLGAGIDTRGDGGYILVEPSQTADGSYVWEEGQGPGEIKLAELPAWVGDILEPGKQMPRFHNPDTAKNPKTHPYAQAAFNDELARLQKARQGNRNHTLNRAAFSLGQLVGSGALDRQEVESRLLAVAVNILALSERESDRTIKSGLESGLKFPRALPDAGALAEYLRDNERADARLFVEATAGKLLFDHTAKSWFRWAGQWWEEDRLNTALQAVDQVVTFYEREANRLKSDIKRADTAGDQTKTKTFEKVLKLVNTRIRDLQTARRRKAVLELATAGDSPISYAGKNWDSEPRLIGLANGVLELDRNRKQITFRDGKQSDFIKTPMPTAWPGDPGTYDLDSLNHFSNSPAWSKFLQEVFAGSGDALAYVQKIFGYSLSGEPSQHILPILYGREGRNGKTTMVEAIKHVMGPQAGVLQKETIVQGWQSSKGSARADLIALQGKRLTTLSEFGMYDVLDLPAIKNITGGDTITARGLYAKDYITFKPSNVVIMLANCKPQVADNDPAAWERIKLVEFSQRFVDQPDPAKPHEHAKDAGLPMKLRAEAQGILVWLAMGWLRYMDEGLQPPESVLAATAAYRQDENIYQAFIDSQCNIGEGLVVKASHFWTAFHLWAHDEGLGKVKQRAFAVEMATRFEKVRHNDGVYYTNVELVLPAGVDI